MGFGFYLMDNGVLDIKGHFRRQSRLRLEKQKQFRLVEQIVIEQSRSTSKGTGQVCRIYKYLWISLPVVSFKKAQKCHNGPFWRGLE